MSVFSTPQGQAAAVGVKAHALFGKTLTEDHYWALLGLSDTAEIANFLRQTPAYKDALELLPVDTVHRVDLENAVRSALLEDAASFLPYMEGGRKKLFSAWMGWFEAGQLRNIFRWIRSRRVDRDSMRKSLHSVPGTKLPYDLLLNSRDYGEALEALAGTKYYDAIKEPIRRLVGGEESLFALEYALDSFIERERFNSLKIIPEEDRKVLMPLFGTRLDLLNLYHFHRCTWYYKMTIEETLTRVLPIKYKVKTHHLREIAKGATWEERLERFEALFPVYGNIFKNALEKPDKELALEMSIRRHNYLKTVLAFQKGVPGFHTAVSYFIIKSYEADDIIKIIENVRYGYDRRTAATYLVRPILGGGELAWQ